MGIIPKYEQHFLLKNTARNLTSQEVKENTNASH
jgi:hypothetical protein